MASILYVIIILAGGCAFATAFIGAEKGYGFIPCLILGVCMLGFVPLIVSLLLPEAAESSEWTEEQS